MKLPRKPYWGGSERGEGGGRSGHLPKRMKKQKANGRQLPSEHEHGNWLIFCSLTHAFAPPFSFFFSVVSLCLCFYLYFYFRLCLCLCRRFGLRLLFIAVAVDAAVSVSVFRCVALCMCLVSSCTAASSMASPPCCPSGRQGRGNWGMDCPARIVRGSLDKDLFVGVEEQREPS